MNLIDLKKDPQPIDSNEMYEEPMYSYGLCINLGKEELEKLGIEKLPEAGSEMMIKAQAYVKTVRESKEKDGVEQNVELQICAMGIEPIDKTKDQAKGLYETQPKPAPKATPVAKSPTYLAQELIMEDPNFTKMSPEFKKRYRQMIEEHKRQEKEKKKNKNKREQFAEKLYGGNK